jgi:hypothetical protein
LSGSHVNIRRFAAGCRCLRPGLQTESRQNFCIQFPGASLRLPSPGLGMRVVHPVQQPAD